MSNSIIPFSKGLQNVIDTATLSEYDNRTTKQTAVIRTRQQAVFLYLKFANCPDLGN